MTAVLVTRPAHQAQAICQQLADAGFSPVPAPLLDIAPLPLDAVLRQQMLDLDLFDIVISVSANASQFALRHIDEFWPQLPFGQNWLAVGDSSARALRQAGLEVWVPEQHDSEGLLTAPQLQAVIGKRVLILRGEGGRETLAEVLRERGARVEYANLYQRVPVNYAPAELSALLHQNNIRAVLLTSGEACQQFAKQLSDDALLQRLTLIVPSKRVQDVAFAAGARDVLVSDGADDQSLVQRLRQWKETLRDRANP